MSTTEGFYSPIPPGPVSYTHLDVYKRQSGDSAWDGSLCPQAVNTPHSAMQSKGAVSFFEICLLVIYFIFSYPRFHMCFGF